MFLGLRTAIYPVEDLAKAKSWYAKVIGIQPYFDQPFYVGFNVGGFELGLDPDTTKVSRGSTPIAYWGVANAKEAYGRLLAQGAAAHTDVRDVGGNILVGAVTDPFGNILGLIENPYFKADSLA